MTISDSIPIQFWIIGAETFNEKVICGLSKQDCFELVFQCGDIINIQFTDTTIKDYRLTILDDNDTELEQVVFEITEVSDDLIVYSYSIDTDSSPSLCDKKIYFRISTFVTDEPTWDNMVTFDTTEMTFDQQ